jgi:hypothetical protein
MNKHFYIVWNEDPDSREPEVFLTKRSAKKEVKTYFCRRQSCSMKECPWVWLCRINKYGYKQGKLIEAIRNSQIPRNVKIKPWMEKH